MLSTVTLLLIFFDLNASVPSWTIYIIIVRVRSGNEASTSNLQRLENSPGLKVFSAEGTHVNYSAVENSDLTERFIGVNWRFPKDKWGP